MESSNLPPKSTLADSRNKSSTPIEIPNGRRSSMPWNGSSSGRPTSPDLIFEMSPVSSDFPSSHEICGFTVSSQSLSPREPFMYSFPKISTHRRHAHSSPRTQPLQKSIFSAGGSLFAHSIPPAIAKHSLSSLCPDIDEESTLSSSLTCSSTTDTKSSSTTKITGFTPVTPNSTQGYSPIRSLKSRRLSPPPRSSSYSSSPWILPGKSDVHGEETGSLETDPSSFEFERHLMRRIEGRSPRRFRRLPLVSSIRV